MTPPPPAAQPIRPGPRRVLLLAVLGLVITLAIIAGAVTLRYGTAPTPRGELLVSGALEVVTAGDPVWYEASPEGLGVPQVIHPTEFLIRSGDVIIVDFPLEVALQQESIDAQLTVDWAAEDRIPDAVFGRYMPRDATGQHLLPMPMLLGNPSSVTLTADSSLAQAYTIRVELDFASFDARFGPDSIEQLTDLGDFSIELHQLQLFDEPAAPQLNPG